MPDSITCIDPVSNLVEMIRINGKTFKHVAEQFKKVWLARCPRPNKCIHDNGGEFIGGLYKYGCSLLSNEGEKTNNTLKTVIRASSRITKIVINLSYPTLLSETIVSELAQGHDRRCSGIVLPLMLRSS